MDYKININDKVICIKCYLSASNNLLFISGKEYLVNNIVGKYIFVTHEVDISVFGFEGFHEIHFNEYFDTIRKIRKEKLNKICIKKDHI